MYPDLKGKVVIVTGAGNAKGIGQGIAKRFAKEGSRVAIVNRPHPEIKPGETDQLEKRKNEILATGGTCIAVRCDVTNEQDVEAMVDAVVKEYGRVDVIVNGVGGAQMNQVGPVIEMNAKAFDDSLALNFKGHHLSSRAVAKRLIAQGGGGTIINISSQAGIHPDPGIGLYSCAKAAINQYTRVLAMELAPHKITVNAVLPGVIMSEKLREVLEGLGGPKGASDEELAKLLPGIPLGRLQTPDDVANSVVWLASEQGNYITGECILTTGGMTMD